MKKVLFFLLNVCFYIFVSGQFLFCSGDRVIINTLEKVESAPDDAPGLYWQLTFKFSKPLFYQKEEVVVGEKVRLYFPGMKLSDFEKLKALKPRVLNDIPVLKNIKVYFESIPAPRVVVEFKFVKDFVKLLLTKTREPNHLDIGIYSTELFKKIASQPTTSRVCKNFCGQPKKKENFLHEKLILL